MMPMMKIFQTVGAHNPDKFRLARMLLDRAQGLRGIEAVDLFFKIGNDKFRVFSQDFCSRKALGIVASLFWVFQRILR